MNKKKTRYFLIGSSIIIAVLLTVNVLPVLQTPIGSNDPNGVTQSQETKDCDAVYLSYDTAKDAKLAQMQGLIECKPSDDIQALMDSTMHTMSEDRTGRLMVVVP